MTSNNYSSNKQKVERSQAFRQHRDCFGSLLLCSSRTCKAEEIFTRNAHLEVAECATARASKTVQRVKPPAMETQSNFQNSHRRRRELTPTSRHLASTPVPPTSRIHIHAGKKNNVKNRLEVSRCRIDFCNGEKTSEVILCEEKKIYVLLNAGKICYIFIMMKTACMKNLITIDRDEKLITLKSI